MLTEYAEKEWKNEKHSGETPVQIMSEVRKHGQNAVAAIEEAGAGVTRDIDEFLRLKNDIYCYKALADHYAYKAGAAIHALAYKHSNRESELNAALPLLEASVMSYRELVNLTKASYLYANSMQTQQRKIPIRGVDGTFKTWTEVLIPFENELSHFKKKLDSLKRKESVVIAEVPRLSNSGVRILSPVIGNYGIDSTTSVFTDTAGMITRFAGELGRLKGLRTSFHQQVQNGTTISFQNKQPVKLLVGFFNSKEPAFLRPPELETNASANDRGQAETKIANAIVIRGMPPVNIHAYDFPAGNNSITLARGACLILGFVDGKLTLPAYDAGLTEKEIKKEIDWLFE
jgi:hypothetical protein